MSKRSRLRAARLRKATEQDFGILCALTSARQAAMPGRDDLEKLSRNLEVPPHEARELITPPSRNGLVQVKVCMPASAPETRHRRRLDEKREWVKIPPAPSGALKPRRKFPEGFSVWKQVSLLTSMVDRLNRRDLAPITSQDVVDLVDIPSGPARKLLAALASAGILVPFGDREPFVFTLSSTIFERENRNIRHLIFPDQMKLPENLVEMASLAQQEASRKYNPITVAEFLRRDRQAAATAVVSAK